MHWILYDSRIGESVSTIIQGQYNAVQETMFEYISVNSFVEDPINK